MRTNAKSAIAGMLKAIILLMTMLSTQHASASDNSARLMLQTGLLYENGWDATLAVEKESRYHNAWEYYLNAYTKWKTCESCGHICGRSLFRNYRTWEVGAAYKPCVSRGKNGHGNVRIGGGVGSDTHKVIGSVHVGYERDYALRGGWRLYWQAHTMYVINGKDHFRTGIAIGVKLPL